jgi:L-lactate dehydrogenase complex protein LldG
MTANADNPHMASFVPETAVVVLRASRIEGTLDDAMARLRVTGDLPRAVSLISGPSRTGDIALKIELGAHGPRRVHIVIVDEPEAA